MFEKIFNILVDMLGEPKQGPVYDPSRTQLQFCCPCCTAKNFGAPDGKYNLEVLLSVEDGLKYHCWKCGDTDGTYGNLRKLIKDYGTREHYSRFCECISDIVSSKLYNINEASGFTETIREKLRLSLPATYTKLVLSECKNKQVLDYVESRKLDQETIDKYSIGYTVWDGEDFAFRNRLIIPSYDFFGDLNYFIGRDYTGKSKIKYRNCDADKTAVIFNESLIKWDSPIYLCEGVFDSMRFPINGISMLGKSLKQDSALFKALYARANATITIVLDGDTDEFETKRIYSMLDFGRLYGKIRYINMKEDCDYKDMSELYENEGREGVIKLLSKEKQYTPFELIC